jgi:glycosyltransferase involved in cell wall biosynthesis
MKIIFFIGIRSESFSAGFVRISSFVKVFEAKGHRVYVISTFSPRSLNKMGLRIKEGMRIYNSCPVFWMENIFLLLFNILSSFAVSFLLLSLLRPKVVIISVPSGEIAVGSYLASKLSRAKVVFDVRDEWEDYIISKASSKTIRETYKLLKALMTSLYNKGDLVVAVTRSIACSLRLRGIRKVEIVPNGADVNVFRPYGKNATRRKLGLKSDEFIIVYEGGVGGYYRLDVVVRALARLDNVARNKIRLLIIGSGDVPNVLKLAENLGLKDNVIYLGVKNDKVAIAQIISSSDVGIIPLSLDYIQAKSALPVKFFEYCACGVPVVATVPDDSVLAKLIKECKVGISVSSMDEKKLSEAILWIYQSAQLREVMGRRARMLIEGKFDRNKIADEFFKLIEECVSNE